MSSITGLISGGGGGGTPVNGIERLYVGGQVQYTDESGGVWLKTGNGIISDTTAYPDAYETIGSFTNSSILYAKSFTQSNQYNSIFFHTDGSKMYLAAPANIYQYSLSIAFDINTATYDNVSYSTGQNNYALTFNSNGTKFYVGSANFIQIYSLSTAWDISSASSSGSFDINISSSYGIETNCTGLAFSPSGTRLYYCGTSTDRMLYYDLTTPYDLSTVTGSNAAFQNIINPYGLFTNNNGDIYYTGSSDDTLYKRNSSFASPIQRSLSIFTPVIFGICGDSTTISGTDSRIYLVGSNNVVSALYAGNSMGLSEDTGTYDYIKLK